MPEYTRPDDDMLDAAHVEQRAIERYGVAPSADDLSFMAKQCQKGHGVFVERRSRNVATWLVWWPEAHQIVPVYYHNKRKRVVTVLKKTMTWKSPASERSTEDFRQSASLAESAQEKSRSA